MCQVYKSGNADIRSISKRSRPTVAHKVDLLWHVGRNEVLDARFEGYQSFAHQALLIASSFENNSKCMAEIDLVVAQPGRASSHHGDLSQKSCNGFLANNLETLLDMFRFVRARNAKVFLPASLQTNDDLSECVEEVENTSTMMLDCVFGERQNNI